MADLSELIKLLLILASVRDCFPWKYRAKYKGKNMTFWEIVKYERPSYFRNVQIHSRFGHYLEITERGDVRATWDPNSPDTVLEMSSYGVLYKRIRRPNSHYLAIDNTGRITTRNTRTNDTLFREYHGGRWMWYRNDVNKYILAFKKNGKPRHRVTNRRHKAKTQFLIIPLCGRRRCLENGLDDLGKKKR